MRDEQIWHGEERGVHDSRRPREDEHAPLGLSQRHEHHPHAVDQLAADVNRFSPRVRFILIGAVINWRKMARLT